MLNMHSTPARDAPKVFQYISMQVIKADELSDLGAQAKAGLYPYSAAFEEAVAHERGLLTQEFKERAIGLLQALEAAGERSYATAWREALMLGDTVEFDQRLDMLTLAFSASGQTSYAKALAEISRQYRALIDPNEQLIGDRAEAALTRPVQPMIPQERIGMTSRSDTDPRLAALLAMPQISLTETQANNLLKARTTEGRLIEGKQYHSDGLGFLDVTFSASKGVSAVWALGTPEERRAVFRAHREAVEHVLRRVEATIGHVRFSAGGDKFSEPAHITWILCHHETARATPGNRPDPDLHTHALIPNVTISKTSDRVGSLFGYAAHGKWTAIRQAYHQRLTQNLNQAGIEARYDPDKDDVVLARVSPEMLQQFSKRTEQIERAARVFLAKRGMDFDNLSPRERSRWMTKAAAATRRNREQQPYPVIATGLRPEWQRQAISVGWDNRRFISYHRALSVWGISPTAAADSYWRTYHRPKQDTGLHPKL